MRQAAANLAARRNRDYQYGGRGSIRVSTPSPISGWNTRDGANEIGPEECFDVQNFIPEVGGLVLRPGYSSFYEGSSAIYSMPVWSSGADEVLLVATANSISTTDGSASVSSLLSGYWSSAMMNDRLGLVNGFDAPRYFDGLNFGTLSISGPAEPLRLRGIKVHKSRSYFWNEYQLGFWYSQPNALGGVLTYFPLTTVAQKGGYVMSCNTWTKDGGAGPDDFFVVTTSKGEVIVYAGSNPSDANDWSLVGRFYIAEPISQRGFLELDGRLWVLTKTDIETLPDRFNRQSVPPTKLSGAIRQAYDRGRQYQHWQISFDPLRQLVIINVPIGDETAEQFVIAPRGMTRFTRINAYCWAPYRGEMYWAGKGIDNSYLSYGSGIVSASLSPLYLLVTTSSSFTTNHHVWRMQGSRDNGDFIWFDVKTGYSPLRTGQEKRLSMYRPLLVTSGTIHTSSALSFDYSNVYKEQQTFSQETEGTEWGEDWGVSWQAENRSKGQWMVGHGTGQTVSLRLSGITVSPVQWAQTDWEYQPGGRY